MTGIVKKRQFWSGLATIFLSFLLLGCDQSDTDKKEHGKYLPQVIFQLDNDRFLTLENYENCEGGKVWYNDTGKALRHELSEDILYYQGKVFFENSDPDIVVLPKALRQYHCNNRGVCWESFLSYSVDGGNSFSGLPYGIGGSGSHMHMSRDFAIIVNDEKLYVVKYMHKRDYHCESTDKSCDGIQSVAFFDVDEFVISKTEQEPEHDPDKVRGSKTPHLSKHKQYGLSVYSDGTFSGHNYDYQTRVNRYQDEFPEQYVPLIRQAIEQHNNPTPYAVCDMAKAKKRN